LLVGRVVAAQGLAGELRVQPLSDFPERFTSPGGRWLRRRGEPARCWQLLSGRQLPGRELFVLRLAAIDNRTAAEALVGADLLVAATDRPTLAEGEFHLLDLVGLEVRLLPEGRPIGRRGLGLSLQAPAPTGAAGGSAAGSPSCTRLCPRSIQSKAGWASRLLPASWSSTPLESRDQPRLGALAQPGPPRLGGRG
jgi:16S rRNA processing protein RimM